MTAAARTDSEKALKKELESIYTPLSKAKIEIWKRWNDKKLRKEVDDFLGNDLPDFLQGSPKGFLVRQITSPDIEFFLFLDLIKLLRLEPAFIEFGDDKLASCNPDKYYRCKMFFYEGMGKNGGNKVKSKKIVDIDAFDGKKINDVKTIYGNSLLSFHHELIKKIQPSITTNIFDVSAWAKRNGKTANNFYLKYLAWFVCHGVLFENFSNSKEEIGFTRSLVLENIKKIEEKFGVKPLIVPTISIEDQEEIYWWYYPRKVEEIIDSL